MRSIFDAVLISRIRVKFSPEFPVNLISGMQTHRRDEKNNRTIQCTHFASIVLQNLPPIRKMNSTYASQRTREERHGRHKNSAKILPTFSVLTRVI